MITLKFIQHLEDDIELRKEESIFFFYLASYNANVYVISVGM